MHQHRVHPAHRDQAPVVLEHRGRIGHRLRGVDLRMVRVQLQPGRAGGEAGVGAGVPRHGRARVVAALGVDGRHHLGRVHAALLGGDAVHVADLDVLVVLDRREGHVGHAEFFALVDIGRALHAVQEGRQHLGRLDPVAPVIAEARHRPRLVVVVQVEAVPPLLVEGVLPARHRRLQVAQVQRLQRPLAVHVAADAVEVHVLELEQHVQRAGLGVRQLAALRDGGQRRLADGDGVVVVQHLLAHLAQELQQARTVAGQREAGLQEAVAHDGRIRQAAVGVPRLRDHVDHVHAEAVDALVEPEAHDVVHLGPQRRVLPVQVRLLAAEHVQVVLAGGLVPLPDRAVEGRFPVGGRRTIGLGVTPEVVAVVRVVAALARLLEPGVLVRAVVDDEVHHQPDAARVHLREHLVELGHRAELGRDGAVVADVVAVVVLRRGVDRRQPDHVDAEQLQVVQLRRDAGQVTDAVAVAVAEAARVDLVDDGLFPPVAVRACGHGRSRVFNGFRWAAAPCAGTPVPRHRRGSRVPGGPAA